MSNNENIKNNTALCSKLCTLIDQLMTLSVTRGINSKLPPPCSIHLFFSLVCNTLIKESVGNVITNEPPIKRNTYLLQKSLYIVFDCPKYLTPQNTNPSIIR